MLQGIVGAVRFFWVATAGNRLRPWRSAYLRWRMETYSGQKAETLTARDFLHLFLAERRQMLRFFVWAGSLEHVAHGKRLK